MKFDELNLHEGILEGIRAMNFEECTPIQEQAIPFILEGRDLLASAQTGTGKTAAYLLPILNKLTTQPHPEDKVNCIIMAPTRELALQVDRLMEGFAYFLPISAIAVYGGNNGEAYAQQERAMQMGGDIVIATPGRLLSHLRLSNVDLSAVKYFILDEADRMLDIGFFDDILEIISYLPNRQQTIMFSATFPPEVEKLAKQLLRDPAEVKIAVSKPADGITQGVYLLHEKQKNNLVMSLFSNGKKNKSIIFAGKKEKVRDVYRSLKTLKLSVAQMHSGLTQEERNQVMLDFKNNKIQALVATDIVSRGIDIDDIDMVVNYDVPGAAEDYVHRVGRTARAGAEGLAVTLVTPEDRYRFDKIERFLGKQIERYPLPDDVAALAPLVEDKPMGRSSGGSQKRNSSARKGGQKYDRSKEKPKASQPDPSSLTHKDRAIDSKAKVNLSGAPKLRRLNPPILKKNQPKEGE